MKSIKTTITFLFMCLLITSVGFSNASDVKEKLSFEMEMLKANPNGKDKATLGAIRLAKGHDAVMNQVKVHLNQEKIDYYHDLKINPIAEHPYENSRECEDTDNGATDSYGDGCDGYTTYPSWCDGYDDDDFISTEMCCACGGGQESGDDTGGDDSGDDGADGGTACADTYCGYMLDYGYDCAYLEYYGEDCSACADEGYCGGDLECFDDPGYNFDVDGDGYVDEGSMCGYYVLVYGYSCEEMIGYGYDCAAVDDCGGCPEPNECDEAGGNSGWQSDGYCDSNNNNEVCGFDGGDCCACDCVDGAYSCDLYGGGDCQNPDGNDGDVECWDGAMECAAEDCSEQPGGCDDGFTGYILNLDGGSYQQEISWTMSDGSAGGAPFSAAICLADGDYTVNGCDSYGDGWNGNILTLTNEDGDLFASWDGPSADLAANECEDFSFTLGAAAPVVGCTDPEACNYDATATIDAECFMDDCAGECGGVAVEDCYGECGGVAVADDCGECGGDGTACAECSYPTWYDDQYCDSSNNTAECGYDGGDCCPGDCLEGGANNSGSYDCAVNGGDCYDCADPESADLLPGGDCFAELPDAPADLTCAGDWDVTDGPTIELSWSAVDGADSYEVFYYQPSCEEQELFTCYDGSCAATEEDCPIEGECPEGYTLDCAEGDFDCGIDSWIGDGYCDGVAQAYGINFCCFDLDGGDCTEAECEEAGGTDGTAACADTDCGNYLDYGYDCATLEYYGYDCSACADEGACGDVTDGGANCTDSQYECGDGSCIPASYYCDGSVDNGNAGWGPDCADGSDEVLAECCDNGYYDDATCGGGDTDGDDGGASDCVDTDNGATDPYGDDCAAYNNYPSWCGNYDDDDFVSNDMCCICGGGTTGGGGDIVVNPFTNNYASIIKGMTDTERMEYLQNAKYEIALAKNGVNTMTVLDRMAISGVYDIQFLINNGFVTNNTRDWMSLGTTVETTMSITGVGDSDWSFGVTAINVGGSSDMTTVDGCAGGDEPVAGGLLTMEDLTASGVCDDYDGDGVEDNALSWTWTDPNEADPFQPCEDGSEPMIDCVGTPFCNNEPAFTGYDCFVGCENAYLGDTYCDDGTWGVNFQCEEYSNDCGDCDGDDMGDVNGYCSGDVADTGTDGGGCDETQWECGDGSCIPASYYCDGSVDNGNAGWGPDCADGSDEILADCCDAGAASYNGYCDGGDDGGDDGGSSDCVDTDNGATDSYGDGCDGYTLYPSWCDGYDDDDFISTEMCCACGGGSTGGGGDIVVNPFTNNYASIIKGMDQDEREEYFTTLKGRTENRRSPFNLVNPPMIVDVDGNVLLDPTPNNRTISYEINAHCDACLDGEAWEATYTSSTAEFLVYGFDEGVEACAEVRALSDLSNEISEWSETACANAGCGPDCVAGDANGDGNVNVSDIVLLVGAILNNGGSTDGVECGDMDGGGVINVSDIVGIINIILNPMDATSNATEAKLNIGSDVSITANGQISAIQMVLSHNSDFSLELTQDAWVTDYSTMDNKTTLIVVMPNSEYLFTPNGEFTIEETLILGLENEIDVNINTIPFEFSVSDAYPNPFNPVTALNINLPEENLVKVSVYNVTGQMVDAVFSSNLAAGTHSITWDAGNLSSGVYLIRTEAGKNISIQKVMLLK